MTISFHADWEGGSWNPTIIDTSPRPNREFMSEALANCVADMVTERLPEDHPFRKLSPDERAEVCRAAHFFASLRG